MPLASTWRGSCPTPGGQAPVAVPAVTRSRVKHARQREAAVGRGTGRPAEAAVVVVPSAGSGQRWATGGVHLHMVGQTPKVHLVQAVGMLMIWRCPSGGMTRGWESWSEQGGKWHSQQTLWMWQMTNLRFGLTAGPPTATSLSKFLQLSSPALFPCFYLPARFMKCCNLMNPPLKVPL